MTSIPDRVRENTSPAVNAQIDHELWRRLHYYKDASPRQITLRIKALDEEWDIERVLEANASLLSLSGVLFSLMSGERRWLSLPLVVGVFLFQHAMQGWCPPIEFFRRIGIRTRKEIDTERYALKMLRGDFDDRPARQDVYTMLEMIKRG
jgi:hypothetical protein